MCGTAVAMLGVTPDQFFEMVPVEFYYALKSLTERERLKSQELLEVARFEAVLIINYVGHLEKFIEDPRMVWPFPWVEGYTPRELKEDAPKQSPQDVSQAVLAMARRLGAKKGTRMPNDPPTLLAPQYRK